MKWFSHRSKKAQAEAKIMLTAKFFDSEGEDFIHYLADYYDLTVPGFPREALEQTARNICDTYLEVLTLEYEREYAADGI